MNPNKYIRKYFFDTLTTDGLSVFDSRKGLDSQNFYVLLSTQSKIKEKGNKCSEYYDCTINLEIIQVSPKEGNAVSRVSLDDAEEKIMDAYDSLAIENFNETEKNYTSTDLVTYGVNEIIKRIIVTINFKLYEQ